MARNFRDSVNKKCSSCIKLPIDTPCHDKINPGWNGSEVLSDVGNVAIGNL